MTERELAVALKQLAIAAFNSQMPRARFHELCGFAWVADGDPTHTDDPLFKLDIVTGNIDTNNPPWWRR